MKNNDHKITNKKSLKTTKKKVKSEELRDENPTVRFFLDNTEYNLAIEEIVISNFDALAPLVIEYSDQPPCVVDNSTKNETKDEMERIRQERERRRQEELKKLREQERLLEEEMVKESQRNREQRRLRENERRRQDDRVVDNERRKQEERFRNEERRREEDSLRDDQLRRGKERLREDERRREEEKMRNNERLRQEDAVRNEERRREENRLRDEQRRREEDRLRDDERRKEEDNMRNNERLRQEESNRNEQRRTEEESFKDELRRREDERLRDDERRKEEDNMRNDERRREEERNRDEEKRREEDRAREDEKRRGEDRLKDDEKRKEEDRVKDDERRKEEENIRNEEKRKEEDRARDDERRREEDRLKDDEKRKEEDRTRDDERRKEEERTRDEERRREEDRNKQEEKLRDEERTKDEERRREEDRTRDQERLKEEERTKDEEKRRENDRIKDEEKKKEEDRAKEEERKKEEERLKEEEATREIERKEEEKKKKEEERLKEEHRRQEEERLKDEEMDDLLKEIKDDDEDDEELKNSLRNRKKRNRNTNLKNREKIYRPQFHNDELDKEKLDKLWGYMDTYIKKDTDTIEKDIVRHIELTLGRNRFKITKSAAYMGAAFTVRDRLNELWNDYEIISELENPKRVNYISIEFMMGRLLKSNLTNLNLEEQYRNALQNLGFNLDEIYELENDPGLGKSGLGKLAACFLDSLTTLSIPAFGYGLRYDYGHFQQRIQNNQQKEFSEFWLLRGNPFEVPRLDVRYTVKFFGNWRMVEKDGKHVCVWENTQDVEAVAYDTVISGYETFSVNVLRLWKSYPIEHFDFENFHKTNYQGAIFDRNATSHLTSVMYPNENSPYGKEFKLMQQYFLVSATIQDIVRRFSESKLPWSEFPNKNAIQINDVHPTLAIPELLRILVDEYELELHQGIDIVNRSFSFSCHNVLQSHMQQWYVDFFAKVLPRHMEMIYIINHYFLESVREKHPIEWNRHREMSCIEETKPKQIRMHNLAIVGSHIVNGLSKTHTRFLKQKFHYFDDFLPKRITNLTNGVNTRRWVHLAFPELSSFLTRYSGNTEWLDNWVHLENLKTEALNDEETKSCILKDLASAKNRAKSRLVNWLKLHHNIDISTDFLFDVQLKNIHENTRQIMNLLYSIDRYLRLKAMSAENREEVLKRVTFFGGKAEQTDSLAKNILQLINQVANIINQDSDTNNFFKIVFIPDYKVTNAEIVIPAADVFQSISTPGTEACATSNMKAAVSGALLIASRDGSNFEIGEEIGKGNIFFFGKRFYEAENIRNKNIRAVVDERLKTVLDSLLCGQFGNINYVKDYLSTIFHGNDFYLIGHDYVDYALAQENVDKAYKNYESWYARSLNSIASMNKFSSDYVVDYYSKKIWNVEPFEIPEPVIDVNDIKPYIPVSQRNNQDNN